MMNLKKILANFLIVSLLVQSGAAWSLPIAGTGGGTGGGVDAPDPSGTGSTTGSHNLPGAQETTRTFLDNLLTPLQDPSASVPNTLPSAPALGALPTERESREGSGTIYAKFCTEEGKTPAPTQDEPMPCCWGLTLNNGKCEDPSMVDPVLTRCSGDQDCSGGKGCFTFSASKDMFNSDNYLDQNKRNSLKAILTQEVMNHSPLKTLGQPCYQNAQCESRSCSLYNNFNVDSKQCIVARGVCRKAEAFEVANGSVQCAAGLTKDSASICKPQPLSSADIARGLIDSLDIKEVGVCRYQLDDGVSDLAKLNIKALRALEILFATAEVDPNRFDATHFVSGFMKPEIGQKIQAARVDATNKFNTEMKLLDLSQSSLESAKVGDKTKVSFMGSQVTRDDLANGSIDGYYPNIIRKKRNEVFQAYELAIYAMLNDTAGAISGASNFVQTIPSGSKDWTIGSVHFNVTHPTKGRPELWDSLTHRYQIFDKPRNWSVFNQSSYLQNYMTLVRDFRPHDYFGSNTYWMLDPVMPEGINPNGTSFMWFGNHDGAWFNDQKWWRKFNEFTGGNGNNGDVSHFEEVKKQFKKYIVNYFKTKRDPNIQGYVFEPELLAIKLEQANDSSTSNQNCLDRLNPDTSIAESDACYDAQEYVDQLTDVLFAQWWMWSAHNQEGFFKFWGYNNTWRAYLVRHYEVIYANLSRYYYALSGIRLLQNDCLQKLIDQHQKNSTDDGVVGLGEGATDYTTPASGDGGNGGSKPPKRTPIEFVKDPRGGLSFDPSKLNFNDFKGNSYLDKFGLTSTKTSGTGAIGKASASDQAAFNARIKKMKDDVAKLSASDAQKRDKVSAKIASIASSAAGSRGGSQSSSGANSAGLKGFGNLSKASLSKDASKDSSSNSGDVLSKGAAVMGAGAAATKGNGNDMNYNAYNSSSTSSTQSSPNDTTGMSDEEKATTLANLERTKSKYNPNENDTLFGVVSKAYMRNLDKFLKKKKTIQE